MVFKLHLDAAYKHFRFSKGKGRKCVPPRFETHEQSATFTKAGFSIKAGEVYLAKIRHLIRIWSRGLPSDPSSVTVMKDCANRYFLSFVGDRVSLSNRYEKPARLY